MNWLIDWLILHFWRFPFHTTSGLLPWTVGSLSEVLWPFTSWWLKVDAFGETRKRPLCSTLFVVNASKRFMSNVLKCLTFFSQPLLWLKNLDERSSGKLQGLQRVVNGLDLSVAEDVLPFSLPPTPPGRPTHPLPTSLSLNAPAPVSNKLLDVRCVSAFAKTIIKGKLAGCWLERVTVVVECV